MLAQDLRYAFRSFARTPGFTAAAVFSIALGIGANTAIFSVAGALLLRPLPYQDADRVAILWNRSPGLNIAEDWFSTAQYFDIRSGNGAFEQLAIALGANYNLSGEGDPERVGVVRVSSNLLPMLGARVAFGRLFLPAEDAPGQPATAILSHALWARRFSSDPHIVGRSITLNGQPVLVAGVLARTFTLPHEVLPVLYGTGQADVLLPLPLAPAAAGVRTHEDYNILGKLRRGVTAAQAQAGMDPITARLRRDYPEFYPPNGGLTFSVVPIDQQVTGDVRRPLLILSGAVGFVLLIACANVANLLLSRALSRQKEIAVRVALGAGRWRIVRQILAESVLLAFAGGALGVCFAAWGVHWIRVLGLKSVPRLDEIAIDGRVLLFTAALSLFAGVLFGLAPAWYAGGLHLHARLKDAVRGSTGFRGNRPRHLLLVSELALAVVLLFGAGLLIRSFANILTVPAGFNPRNVLAFELTMTGRSYNSGAAVLEAYRRMWERFERLPGVTAAGAISALPLSQMYSWGPISIEGRTPVVGEQFINADQRVAAGRYFQAMEIPLLRGRLFNEHDTADQPRVAIVDDAFAAAFWAGEDPIGKRIKTGGIQSADPWRTVVGVVGRVKQYTLDSDSRIAMYFPQTQSPVRSMNVVLRSGAGAAELTAAVRRELREVDSTLPVYGVGTMQARVDLSLARRRFAVFLLTLFAGLAVVLAGIGAYGVMSFLVGQRAREIGIRMALGATGGSIARMVLGRAMGVAAAGLVVGLAGAAGVARVMRSLLFGTSAYDGVTLVGVCAVLAAVALVAAFFPARRAARTDPGVSLRAE